MVTCLAGSSSMASLRAWLRVPWETLASRWRDPEDPAGGPLPPPPRPGAMLRGEGTSPGHPQAAWAVALPVTHTCRMVAGASASISATLSATTPQQARRAVGRRDPACTARQASASKRVGLKVDTAARSKGHAQPVGVQEPLEAARVAYGIPMQQRRQHLSELDLAMLVCGQGLTEPLDELTPGFAGRDSFTLMTASLMRSRSASISSARYSSV